MEESLNYFTGEVQDLAQLFFFFFLNSVFFSNEADENILGPSFYLMFGFFGGDEMGFAKGLQSKQSVLMFSCKIMIFIN